MFLFKWHNLTNYSASIGRAKKSTENSYSPSMSPSRLRTNSTLSRDASKPISPLSAENQKIHPHIEFHSSLSEHVTPLIFKGPNNSAQFEHTTDSYEPMSLLANVNRLFQTERRTQPSDPQSVFQRGFSTVKRLTKPDKTVARPKHSSHMITETSVYGERDEGRRSMDDMDRKRIPQEGFFPFSTAQMEVLQEILLDIHEHEELCPFLTWTEYPCRHQESGHVGRDDEDGLMNRYYDYKEEEPIQKLWYRNLEDSIVAYMEGPSHDLEHRSRTYMFG